jgi:hypothetical protein
MRRWMVPLPLLLWALDIAVIVLIDESGHTVAYTAGILDKLLLLGLYVGGLLALPATLIAWMVLRNQQLRTAGSRPRRSR